MIFASFERISIIACKCKSNSAMKITVYELLAFYVTVYIHEDEGHFGNCLHQKLLIFEILLVIRLSHRSVFKHSEYQILLNVC